MNIFFLDIDGVFIPRRAYSLPWQTRPLVTRFDPCVVGNINRLARKYDVQFVIHSSWLRAAAIVLKNEGHASVKQYMINQGLEDYFHEDHEARWRFSGTRWLAIREWLDDHPNVQNFWIWEDDACPVHYEPDFKASHVLCDFDEGPSMDQFMQVEHELATRGVPRRVVLETEA